MIIYNIFKFPSKVNWLTRDLVYTPSTVLLFTQQYSNEQVVKHKSLLCIRIIPRNSITFIRLISSCRPARCN